MRKLQLLAAMFAMVLVVASPAAAQQIEFVEGGVLIVVEGTGSLEEAPVTGVFGVPTAAGAVAGGGALSVADSAFGAFTTVGASTNAAGIQTDAFVQAGSNCIDTTGFGLCP